MKTEEQIKEEIEKHEKWLKKNRHNASKNDIWLHNCIIEGLKWVIKKED